MIRVNFRRYLLHFALLGMIISLLLPGWNKDEQPASQQEAENLAASSHPANQIPANQHQDEASLGRSGLGLSEEARRQLGLGAYPERRILQDLAVKPQVFPNFGQATPVSLLLHESVVLSPSWVLAVFISEQGRGQALFTYQIDAKQEFTWQLLAQQLLTP